MRVKKRLRAGKKRTGKLPLPKNWTARVKSALVEVIALAHLSLTVARGRMLATGGRVADEVERLKLEVALLAEEVQIKDARLARICPHRRPRYAPVERLRILELRAARGWSLAQTARRFLVTAETVASWCKRIDEQGPDALLALAEPVNKFPDFVRYAVRRLKVLCPMLGKVKIARILCRAGLHLGPTTVGRMLKEQPSCPLPEVDVDKPVRVVTAKRPNHVWHVDLTTVPIGSGFWTPWFPFALPQCWPFCWWVAVVVDHYSRRAMGLALFRKQPTSASVRAFLGRTISAAGAAPTYLISDQGTQFQCDGFKHWCRRRGIKPRYGALDKQGSIAVVERFIRTLKEFSRALIVPLDHRSARRDLILFFDWYNDHRPHDTLEGKTPNEVYYQLRPANRRPRIEPRPHWPRPSPCARPQALVAGQPGDRFELDVELLDGHKELPIVILRRAA